MASFLDFVKGAIKPSNTAAYPYTQTNTGSPTPQAVIYGNTGFIPSGYPGQVQGATTGGAAPTPQSNYSPGYTSGSSGITAPTPDTSAQQNQARSRIQSIQSAYDTLTGNIDQIVNERNAQNNQNYDQQLGNLTNAYSTNAGQLGGAYQARGLGDSSFYGNAQQDAGNIYNQNVGNILQDKSNTAAQLGQYASSSKAQYGAGKNAYNDILGQLGTFNPTQLGDLYNQLGTQLGNVQSQAGGIGTNAQFIDKLNAITPTQNQGTSQLASKLQQLVTSGAPQFAKSQIAQGLIKQAQLTDPTAQGYWTDYYNKLLSGQA